jgi:predicted phage tail protein
MSEEIIELGRQLNEAIENGAVDMSDLDSDETLAVLQYLQSEVLKFKTIEEDEEELIEPFMYSQSDEEAGQAL